MQCREFREIADSYLSDELIVETNHGIISHLEHCAACREELRARRELRSTLREAFIKVPENQLRPEFAECLTTQLHDYAVGRPGVPFMSPSGWRASFAKRQTSWLALAACLVLATGVVLVLVWQRISESAQRVDHAVAAGNTTPGNSPGPAGITNTDLAKSAVGDHRDCAIKFRLAEKPIDLEVAGGKYDRVYTHLTKAVLSEQGEAPLDAQFVEAHSCVFEGRRFAHIVLKYHGRLVSFLVTDIAPEKDASDPARRSADPQVIRCGQFDGYQVSCFETARHAVFVVSDLGEGDNLALARALAPTVFTHITGIEKA